jgi:hypothetical protein
MLRPARNRGSSSEGPRLDRYGRWIAVAGIGLIVSGRLSHSTGVVLFGLAIAVAGIVLGLRAGSSYMQIYVRELIPGGTDQRDPFEGRFSSGQAADPPAPRAAYVGTVVWAGGVGKAVRLELSPSGLGINPTWMSRLLMGKQPSWTLPWSTVRAVEVAKIPGTGTAPSPVKFTISEPSTVFLFFCRTPAVLLEDVRMRIKKSRRKLEIEEERAGLEAEPKSGLGQTPASSTQGSDTDAP